MPCPSTFPDGRDGGSGSFETKSRSPIDRIGRIVVRMIALRLLPAALALVLSTPAAAGPADDRAAILSVVAGMEQSWNRGDFRSYMAGFKNPDVVFVSGGKFQDGWQGTLDHYVRDYGASPATRGTLHFYDMKVELLAGDAAMLVGRYHLERPNHAAEGVNTRLFRKIDGRWLITLNHVSAYEISPAPSPSAPVDRPGRPSN
jgi:ketosteroid isomerase-like protein